MEDVLATVAFGAMAMFATVTLYIVVWGGVLGQPPPRVGTFFASIIILTAMYPALIFTLFGSPTTWG